MTNEQLTKLYNELTTLRDTLSSMIAAGEVGMGACSAPKEEEYVVSYTYSMKYPDPMAETLRRQKAVTYPEVGKTAAPGLTYETAATRWPRKYTCRHTNVRHGFDYIECSDCGKDFPL